MTKVTIIGEGSYSWGPSFMLDELLEANRTYLPLFFHNPYG